MKLTRRQKWEIKNYLFKILLKFHPNMIYDDTLDYHVEKTYGFEGTIYLFDYLIPALCRINVVEDYFEEYRFSLLSPKLLKFLRRYFEGDELNQLLENLRERNMKSCSKVIEENNYIMNEIYKSKREMYDSLRRNYRNFCIDILKENQIDMDEVYALRISYDFEGEQTIPIGTQLFIRDVHYDSYIELEVCILINDEKFVKYISLDKFKEITEVYKQ